jgi:transcriptional regulator with XRE-family HTH domain
MTAKPLSDKISNMPRKPTPQNIETGKRLERLRTAHGYETMRAMAVALDINEATWRAWEFGLNEFPTDIARRLKDRWGVTLDYIYTGAETAMAPELLKKLRKVT